MVRRRPAARVRRAAALGADGRLRQLRGAGARLRLPRRPAAVRPRPRRHRPRALPRLLAPRRLITPKPAAPRVTPHGGNALIS